MQMSASHEYENIITDCIYTRPALQPDCICVSLVESQKKPKNRDIFQSLVYMYARSTAHSLTSRCDAGKTCSLFIPYTGCCITELEIGFSEAAHLFYLLLVFSFLFLFLASPSFWTGGNSIRLLNWLMDNKSQKYTYNIKISNVDFSVAVGRVPLTVAQR